MSKVITFSRYFPKGHIREGQETCFDIKILNGFKNHTIRKGSRWNAADIFSPRQWSEMPYKSKQRIICDDLKIKMIFDIKIINSVKKIFIDSFFYCEIEESDKKLKVLAENDGLSVEDFIDWFKNDFEGQIICWNKEIKY